MSLSLPVGHVLGVPIRLHISWIALFVLLISSLQPVFSASTGGDGWPLALLTTLLLLLSTLLHELGHALVARRHGLAVTSITLFLTGGMTHTQGEARLPRQELQIALAGPLMSLGVAGITALAAVLSAGAYQLLWGLIAAANALIMLFNLLPSYPLDGGRALRAILWFLHDDVLRGTYVAAWLARGLGGMLILLGVVVAITVHLVTGILAALIGWMMQRSALNSYLQMVVQHTLTSISVGEIMSRSYRTVSPQMTLDLFVGQYLLGQSEQGFPVVQAERLLGIITVRNLRHYSMQQWRQTPVSAAMTPSSELPTLKPEDTAHVAFHELIAHRFDQLPVTDGVNLLGMVHRRDLLAFIHQAMEKHA